MKKDLVIGAITGYTFDQIKYWVNSLDRSGFQGLKAVVAYNVDYETLAELTNRGYAVLAFQKDDQARRVVYPKNNFAIVVERFLHYYLLLDSPENRESVRYVIATDVKDVVFQHNPSVYIDGAIGRGHDLIASSEGIAYQHEPWGANNLLQSFGPIMYARHKENTIYNCGVLAAKFNEFLGLAKLIYLISAGTVQHVPGGGGPDQAALNLILSSGTFQKDTDFTTHDHPWACQLGTTLDPTKIKAYQPFLNDAQPIWDDVNNQLVTPDMKIPYAMVHQWDRVPGIKASFERKFS